MKLACSIHSVSVVVVFNAREDPGSGRESQLPDFPKIRRPVWPPIFPNFFFGRIGPADKAPAVLARLQAMPLSCLFPSRSTLSDPFPSTNAAFPSSQCLVPLMFPRPRSNASFRSPSEQGLVPLSFLFRQRLVPLQSKPRAPSTQGLVPLQPMHRSPSQGNAAFPFRQVPGSEKATSLLVPFQTTPPSPASFP